MQTRWRIQLLGELRAEPEGAAADRGIPPLTHFQTQKTATLLAYLAYYYRRTHPREQLMELLWPECAPAAGRSRLSQALSWLRRQLEPPGMPGTHAKLGRGAVIVADRTWVRLNPDAVTTDVAAFESALRAAKRAHSSAERRQCLAAAVGRYSGELLPGFYENWVLGEREWLAARYLRALSQLTPLLEQAGDVERALQYAHQAVSADPLREEAHRELIRLYAAAGQPSAALRHYHQLQRILSQELGTVPDAATGALVREIERRSVLRQDPARTAPPASPTSPADEGRPASPIAAPGGNRLVTILSVGANRSLQRAGDPLPEDAAALLDRLLAAIAETLARYGGRVERCLGDGVLAAFGVPQAHEDDPERAVRAALQIRDAARKIGLEITVGIDTGRVYVGGTAGKRGQQAGEAVRVPELEPGMVGPAISRAVRLQEQAELGQILVGTATYRLARGAFEFSHAAREASGIAEAVPAYAVGRPLPRPEKAYGIEGMRAELVGRDEELAKLRAVLAAVLQGEGQIVSLIGEAGIGKSRLVAELRQGVGCRGWGVGSEPSHPTPNTLHPTPLWLEGRCLELGMTAGYSVFVDLFRDFFGWGPEEEDQRRGERLAACLQELAAAGVLSEERAGEMGPLLGNLLSLRFRAEWDARLQNAGPEQIKHQTFLAVRDFFAALARTCRAGTPRPVVLVFEDLHWADHPSLDLISLLMEALTEAPLLLLCVYRPEREHRSWHLSAIAARKCSERYTELHLRELTQRQSYRLVASLLGDSDPPSRVSELIWERSGGNPFFVEELVRSLIDAGTVYQDDHGWRAREPGTHGAGEETVAVSESIQSLVMSRLDRLGPELRRVLQHASVIGRLFRKRLMERTVGSGHWAVVSEGQPPGSPLPELPTILWDLEDRDFIYRERAVPEEEYSFKHALIQETIYGSIPRRQRAMLHQQVAEAIEALYPERREEHYEALAYHYGRSGADEKAVEYLLKAGEKARQAYLNEAAAGCFQRAMERLSRFAPEAARKEAHLEALQGLGRIYLGLGKVAQAETCLRDAIALGREIGLAPAPLARLHFWLGDALYWQGRYDEMLHLGQTVLEMIGEDTESTEAALANVLAALGHACKGNLNKYQALHHRNAGFLERLPYSEELRPAYSHIVEVYLDMDKDEDAAIRWLQSLQGKARVYHDLRAAGIAQLYTGRLLYNRGDLRGLVSQAEAALDLFQRIGDAKHESWCLTLLGRTLPLLGELQQAEAYARRELEIQAGVGSKRDMAASYVLLGTTSFCRGSWEAAAEAFEQAAQLARGVEPQWEVTAMLSLGQVHLARRQREQAIRHFRDAMRLAALYDSAGWVIRARTAALSGLERASEDPEEFRAFCRCFREEHPEARAWTFGQWFLTRARPQQFSRRPVHEEFAAPPSPNWTWYDPLGDCSFSVRNGLEIHAANGRDLWLLNHSAPCLLRPAAGDFAIQTVCLPVSREQPAIGGILLRKEPQNFLRLERANEEIGFLGCLAGRECFIGRGRLPSDRTVLRLERRDGRVKALCSAEGRTWFTAGSVAFAVEDPVEVGVHAIGMLDRMAYPVVHRQGSAIRFGSFEIWR